MAEKSLEKTISLPNTFETWSRVSANLRNIQEGQVHDLEEFEKLYLQLEFTAARALRTPKFATLRAVLKKAEHITESHFLDTLLPWIAGKALEVEELFQPQDSKLPLLRKQDQNEVVLTRSQVCCILSLAFFGILSKPEGAFQHLLLTYFLEVNYFISQRSKLLCLLTYFDRIRQSETDFLAMNVSIRRQAVEKKEPGVFWGKCELPLGSFSCEPNGVIEDSHGDLQVDFANEYIGGGVLQMGNVQEEIHFVINPECLVSMLVCERMEDNEAILIQGAEQFSKYAGYGGTFTYAGPHIDKNPIDELNRRCVSIVAIDAIPQGYENENEFEEESIARELYKAYCGFSFRIAGDDPDSKRPVATGNWGCGMFGGNKELKTLVQWMAASLAGRPLKYFTFGDNTLSEEQTKIAALLREKGVTVGQLYDILVASCNDMQQKGVFACVRERV